MLQKDHLMRLVTQFQNVMASILGLKRDGRYQEAIEESAQTINQLVSGDAMAFSDLSAEELIRRLYESDSFDTDRALMTADLFSEQADIYRLEQSWARADDRILKALSLMIETYLADPARIPADLFEKIANSIRLLEGKPLPDFVMWQLFRYFEKTGRYDRAENVLFELAEREETVRTRALQEGERFYERLSLRTDDELRRGNLPREELSEGRRELRRVVS